MAISQNTDDEYLEANDKPGFFQRIYEHTIAKFCFGACRRVLWLLGLAVVAIIISVISLMIYSYTGPRSLSYLTPKIQNSLGELMPQYEFQMGDILIYWQDINEPLSLQVNDMVITNRANQEKVAGFKSLLIDVDMFGLLLGEFIPEAMMLDSPKVGLYRGRGGVFFNLEGGGFSKQEQEADLVKKDGANLNEILGQLFGFDGQKKQRKGLKTVKIRNAHLLLGDYELKEYWYLKGADLQFRRDKDIVIGNISSILDQSNAQSRLMININMDHYKQIFYGDVNFYNLAPNSFSGLSEILSELDAAQFSLNGSVGYLIGYDGIVDELELELKSPKGIISYPKMWREPIIFQNFLLKSSLHELNKFNIHALSIDVSDEQEDVMTNISGRGKVKLLDDNKIDLDLTIALKELPFARLMKLWPFTAAPETRNTIKDIIKSGYIKESKVRLDFDSDILASPKMPDEAMRIYIDLQKANLEAVPELPMIKNMKTKLFMNSSTIRAFIDSGMFNGINISDGKLHIHDLQENNQDLELSTYFKSELKDVVSLVKQDFFDLPDDLQLDATNARGEVMGKLDLSLPLAEDADDDLIKYNVSAVINDTYLPGIFDRINLSEGELRFSLDQDKMMIKGESKILPNYLIDGSFAQDTTLLNKLRSKNYHGDISILAMFGNADSKQYQSFFSKINGKYEAKLQNYFDLRPKASLNNRPSLFAIQFDGQADSLFSEPQLSEYISGNIIADAFLAVADKRMIGEVNADLGKANISIAQIGFSKDKINQNSGVNLHFNQIDNKPFEISKLNLQLRDNKSRDLHLNSNMEFSNQEDLIFNNITLDKFNYNRSNVYGSLNFRSDGGYQLKFRGKSLDLHQYNELSKLNAGRRKEKLAKRINSNDSNQKQENPKIIKEQVTNLLAFLEKPFLVDLKLSKLFMAENNPAMEDIIINIDCLSNKNQKCLANISGKYQDSKNNNAELRAILRNNGPNQRKLEVTTPELGTLLKKLKLSDDMDRGSLLVIADIDNNFSSLTANGKLLLKDFHLSEAPVLAKILNFTSLTSALQTLSGQGLNFDRLEAPFTFADYRFNFKKAQAYGNAIGITANGIVTMLPVYVDLKGVVAPIQSLNRLINNIPLLGELITGGEGEGLFAVSYYVSGLYPDVEVSVNPLSVLTPGILRDVFSVFDSE